MSRRIAGLLGAVAMAATGLAFPPTAQAQSAAADPAYATCGEADHPFAEAALKNADLIDTMEWAPFGVAEKGWEIYAPLLQREIGVTCGFGTAVFAQGVAELQTRHGLKSDGVFGPDTFTVLKGLLQERRPFVMARVRGECPAAPATFIMTNLPGREDTYGREDRRLRGDALVAYRAMVEAARRDGVLARNPGALTIFSGYRQPDADGERCAIEGNCDGKRRAACSPHGTGYAVDLNLGHLPESRIDSTAPANRLFQTRTEAYRWLVRNAHRFGFVNYVFEPWHWEWVGEASTAESVALPAVANQQAP